MRVLVVDAEPEIQQEVGRLLDEAGYAVVVAGSAAEALEAASLTCFDMMLTDLTLPDMSGIELCWALRSQVAGGFQYQVVMTAQTEIKYHIEALDSGADDFLPKPVEPGLLFARLRLGARMIAQQREMHRLATTDELSGLANRRSFLERGEGLLERCRRTDHRLAVLMADIDHFKRINDSRGHAIGDLVIRAIADLLHVGVQEPDLTGRLGGEEFALLLTGLDLREAGQRAEALRRKVTELDLAPDGIPLPVSVSFGVATVKADDPDLAQALSRADAALYASKHGGRNRVTMDAASR